ncbi:LPXTG cell wall anchor domain-containing protein [Symbioplanes lichenis]|uniref:LPXTG cell wall anchor domain-containing protein n=1 Tax=Symbioplanes lichenis TaxID=1629072 RepID=UPI00273A11E1|nr:LPXTG cell wall anchor domain-containing protein [Actinoplanes lichenis]
MSFARRLAAGLPVAGVTALAALAFTGAPAAATGDEAARVAHPAVMTTPSADDQRTDADGYGGEAPDSDTPTRGQQGYGSESPATTPPTTPPTASPSPSTPTASVDTVPPGGELPATSPAPSPSESTPGGGVSAGGTLPLTGAPLGLTAAVGGALLVAGAGAVLYGRRRKA